MFKKYFNSFSSRRKRNELFSVCVHIHNICCENFYVVFCSIQTKEILYFMDRKVLLMPFIKFMFDIQIMLLLIRIYVDIDKKKK